MTVASTKEIKDFTPAPTILDNDSLAASVSNKTRRVAVSALREQILSVPHTHAIGDVTGLQAALDAKASLPLSGATDPTVPADYVGQQYIRTAVPYGLFFAVTTGANTIWVRL